MQLITVLQTHEANIDRIKGSHRKYHNQRWRFHQSGWSCLIAHLGQMSLEGHPLGQGWAVGSGEKLQERELSSSSATKPGEFLGGWNTNGSRRFLWRPYSSGPS